MQRQAGVPRPSTPAADVGPGTRGPAHLPPTGLFSHIPFQMLFLLIHYAKDEFSHHSETKFFYHLYPFQKC